jgi:hypothetical protein
MNTTTNHRKLRREQRSLTPLDEDATALIEKGGGTSENTPQSTAAQSYASDEAHHLNAENSPRPMNGQKYLR